MEPPNPVEQPANAPEEATFTLNLDALIVDATRKRQHALQLRQRAERDLVAAEAELALLQRIVEQIAVSNASEGGPDA